MGLPNDKDEELSEEGNNLLVKGLDCKPVPTVVEGDRLQHKGSGASVVRYGEVVVLSLKQSLKTKLWFKKVDLSHTPNG